MKNLVCLFGILVLCNHLSAQAKIGMYEFIARPADWKINNTRYELRNMFIKSNDHWISDTTYHLKENHSLISKGKVFHTLSAVKKYDTLNYFPEKSVYLAPIKPIVLRKEFIREQRSDMHHILRSCVTTNNTEFVRRSTLTKYKPVKADLIKIGANLSDCIRLVFSECQWSKTASDSLLNELFKISSSEIDTSYSYIDNKGVKLITFQVKDKRLANQYNPTEGTCSADYYTQLRGFEGTCVLFPDNKVIYLHDNIRLLEYGDFDKDGKDEYIFWFAVFNHDAYILYSNDFTEQVSLGWSYH